MLITITCTFQRDIIWEIVKLIYCIHSKFLFLSQRFFSPSKVSGKKLFSDICLLHVFQPGLKKGHCSQFLPFLATSTLAMVSGMLVPAANKVRPITVSGISNVSPITNRHEQLQILQIH